MAARIERNATIEKADDSAACGIIVSTDEVVRAFGRKSRIPVRATLNGYEYRSSLSPMGGCHVLPVNADVRKSAAVQAGDTVALRLEEDLDERTVDIPSALARALREAGVRQQFDKMSFTHQKEWVRSILDAKRPETRERRIAACIAEMQKRA